MTNPPFNHYGLRDVNQTPTDGQTEWPAPELQAMAEAAWEIYTAYINVGFNVEQATRFALWSFDNAANA